MFDEHVKEAYKQIKAPEGLYERILAQEEVEPKQQTIIPFIRLTSAAACIAFCMLLTVFGSGHLKDPMVSIEGAILTASEIAVDQPVSICYVGKSGELVDLERVDGVDSFVEDKISVPLHLKISQKGTVTVKDGRLLVDGDEFQEVLEGESFEGLGELETYWIVVPKDGQETYQLLIKQGNKTTAITLIFNPTTREWAICREQM